MCLENIVAGLWKHSRVVIVLKNVGDTKKLSTYFTIQANYTKKHILNNKAAEEIIFPYNTKKSRWFNFYI